MPDGDPDGVRIVEKPGWTGLGVVVPRPLFTRAKKRDEFARTGIYILVGQEDDAEQSTIYIGQGDPVKPRLEQHFVKKDFWNQAIFFVSRDDSLNKAHIGHLESELSRLAASLKRAKLDNSNQPNPTPLAEADAADIDRFLREILDILPLLGLRVFETPKSTQTHHTDRHLTIDAKGLTAKGFESAQGFVVSSGSIASIEETPSVPSYINKLRADLVQQGVMELAGSCFRFTQDYEFSSPSTAAAVVLGAAANGRLMWKNSSGRSLNEIQQNEIEF